MNPMLTYVLLAALLLFMFIRTWKLFARSRKNKAMLEILALLDTESAFYPAANAYIASEKSAEFRTKVEVLRLFADAYYKKDTDFLSHLESLNPAFLLTGSRGLENEDSFFYLYLAIPNRLWYNGRMDLNAALTEKLQPLAATMQTTLLFAMNKANQLYYDKQEDGGKAFDEAVLNGEYGHYRYSRQLISLYKYMVRTVLVRLAKDRDDMEAIRLHAQSFHDFHQSRLGARWLKEWGVDDVVTAMTKKEETQ